MTNQLDLLTRTISNHLFLSQFEPLRALLATLKTLDSNLARQLLLKIVLLGGRLPGALLSSTCRSPSHLAWLSFLELKNFDSLGVDFDVLRSKIDFLILVQETIEKYSNRDVDLVILLSRVLDWGVKRLGSDVESKVAEEEDWSRLGKCVVEYPEIFWAIGVNLKRELESGERDNGVVSLMKNVQLAHLDALKKKLVEGDFSGAVSCVRFLNVDYGVEETVYKKVLLELVNLALVGHAYYGGNWEEFRHKSLLIYTEALSSGCPKIVQIIQAIQDQAFYEEIEHHNVSDADYPLPVQKLLQALHSVNISGVDDATYRSIIIGSCKKELYNYARISGIHVLECVMDAALSAIRKEQIQEASDIASLFPLLQPLVAVLGWDLLSGKTGMRRKLMQLLWTSKSQVLRLEEHSLYGKQIEEVSCVEYLCDLLCFRLDLAYFVACTNSGSSWNSKVSLLFCQEETIANEREFENMDPFVENFVLERLAVQSPLRVLFDLVPGLKFQDAVELISLQPLNSTSAAWKRMQDIELMHMRYALESTVLALGAMEKCSDGANEYQFHLTIFYLKELQTHMEAISNAHRKIYMVSIITSLLHMDDVPIDTIMAPCKSHLAATELPHFNIYSKNGKQMVVSFTGMLLNILRRNLPSLGPEMEHLVNSDAAGAARQALEWRISHAKHFIEDWEWRLSILERLQPLSEHTWSWKEALIILRAAPSKLLNLCLQKAKYDLGEEAVHRFALPAEDKAALELAEWVASTFRRTSVEDVVSCVADGSTKSVQKIDFSSLRSQLGPLASLLLCIDVAATSARSIDTCKLLLEHARSMLSEIYPGTSPKIGSNYWDQIREVTIISASRRILQRLHDLLEQENAPTLQEMFSEEMTVLSSCEPSKLSQRQRALTILHQMIDDAHKGKRQFLSGKLHNLSRALADEDADNTYRKGDGFIYDDKALLTREQGIVLGLGIKSAKPTPVNQVATEYTSEPTGPELKDSKSIFGSITSKPSTYLSSFIIYIATIGDIVDGIDTTHDFNFFSLIYEWPKDLLTSLVFERGSTDAAAKVADIMSVDFVHEVISACVPPVYSPRSGNGWACVPIIPTLSKTSLENKISFSKGNLHNSFSSASGTPLYPLQLDIVKHLAKLSPVRAVLACVFGSSILSASEVSASSSSNDALLQEPDAERLFYEFALDQSERFPTLNRWIQMQSNLHKVSEFAIAAKSNNADAPPNSEAKIPVKRSRDPESDPESEIDDMGISGNISLPSSEFCTQGLHGFEPLQELPKLDTAEVNTTSFLSFDWENEGPYEKAVGRLIAEGKLMDALALSDRCLCSGASDQLLQLLIEHEEENNTIPGQSNGHGFCNIKSTSWQYCLRLKDKQLAARLALKYLHGWELNAAIDVLTMCSCHLPQGDLVRDEILKEFPSLRNNDMIITYASKAIAVNVISAPREPRISLSGSRLKAKIKTSSMSTRSNFTQSIGNLQREARRAFSWNRDTGGKSSPKDTHRKRKSSGLEASERVAWDAMTGIQEEHTVITDGQERLPLVPIVEEWVLTGNSNKDNAVRASHKYETSPDITLFKALLSLCSDELVSAKGSLELCITQMKNVLSSQHLPLNSSMEAMGRAYHATETFVHALSYAKSLLRKLTGTSDSSSNSGKNKDADEVSDTGSSSVSSSYPDDVSEYLSQVDTWLGCAELLQSLLGFGIVASLDDIADKESSEKLRNRLIEEERYSMAIYTCKKCKIDAFPVRNAWGHALIQMERYVQARVKFKYEHLAKSAPTILDDSLSADSYLNVLYMPTTFPRSELSRQFHETRNKEFITFNSEFDDGPRSNLDDIRDSECIHYLSK